MHALFFSLSLFTTSKACCLLLPHLEDEETENQRETTEAGSDRPVKGVIQLGLEEVQIPGGKRCTIKGTLEGVSCRGYLQGCEQS